MESFHSSVAICSSTFFCGWIIAKLVSTNGKEQLLDSLHPKMRAKWKKFKESFLTRHHVLLNS